MTIDELIDWLNAIACQCGSLRVLFDCEDKTIKAIALEAVKQIDHMRSEITWYMGKDE